MGVRDPQLCQVARVRPLLALFAETIEHVGGCGAGHAVKARACVCACVCAHVCACLCVCACICACVRVGTRACMHSHAC